MGRGFFVFVIGEWGPLSVCFSAVLWWGRKVGVGWCVFRSVGFWGSVLFWQSSGAGVCGVGWLWSGGVFLGCGLSALVWGCVGGNGVSGLCMG